MCCARCSVPMIELRRGGVLLLLMMLAARAETAPVRGVPAGSAGARATTTKTVVVDVVPIRDMDGEILVRARLLSPSGRDTTGLFVLDTGAPGLFLNVGVWNDLDVDTLEIHGSQAVVARRPLRSVTVGSTEIRDLWVASLQADTMFAPGVLGLMGPSVFGNRALILDYADQELSIVTRSLTFVRANMTPDPHGVSSGHLTSVRQSRARYGDVLPAEAIPVPIQFFQGGRILVKARVEDPSRAWKSQPISLMVDTGASATVLFDDTVTERIPPLRYWPTLPAVRTRTMLGDVLHNVTLLPRLVLTESVPVLASDRIEAGVVPRRAVPDIQGELTKEIHGLLGYTFLRRFRVVMDYANEVLWLEPQVRVQLPRGDRAQVGLTLEERWGRICVASVTPGSPAEKAGVSFGDVVVSVNGVQVESREPEDVEALLKGEPGSSVVLVVRRGGMERVLRLERAGEK